MTKLHECLLRPGLPGFAVLVLLACGGCTTNDSGSAPPAAAPQIQERAAQPGPSASDRHSAPTPAAPAPAPIGEPLKDPAAAVEPAPPPVTAKPEQPKIAAPAKPVAVDPEVQAKLLKELKPHIAKCKQAAGVVKATILKMRKAVERGDMDALRVFNNQLERLGMKVAVAESGGAKVLDAYKDKDIDVEAAQEQFNAACSTDVE